MGRKKGCKLALVEWEDSKQPIPSWKKLKDVQKGTGVRCVSVGWLIEDGPVKVLVPNMGDLDGDIQVSGAIQIPERCVTRMVRVKEPKISSFASGP